MPIDTFVCLTKNLKLNDNFTPIIEISFNFQIEKCFSK